MTHKLINIPKSTHNLLAAAKQVSGVPMSEIVRRAVQEYIDRYAPEVWGILQDQDAHDDAVDQAAMAHGG